jgi:hypothetical protein
MIDCRKEPLTLKQSGDIAALMQRSDFLLLMKVIESRADELIIEASQKAAKSAESPNYLAVAEASLKDAQKYQACLAVLNEVKENPKPYLVKINAT